MMQRPFSSSRTSLFKNDTTSLLSTINREKGKGGQTGELFCLFYSTAPPTNTLSVYFISLKVVGVWCSRGVVSVKRRVATMGLVAAEGALCLLLAGGGGGLAIKCTTVAVDVAVTVGVEEEVDRPWSWLGPLETKVALALGSRGSGQPWPWPWLALWL